MGSGASGDLDAAGRAFVKEHRPTSLIGRLARTEEVASMVAYLCTPAASATTGAAVRVGGGGVPRLRRRAQTARTRFPSSAPRRRRGSQQELNRRGVRAPLI